MQPLRLSLRTRATVLALSLLGCACNRGPCGSLTAQAGSRVTRDPIETCGADRDSLGLLFTETAELLIRWTGPSTGAVDSSTVLDPRPRLLAWRSALTSGSSLSFPSSLAGDALVFDDSTGAARTLPLTHGSLEVTSWPSGETPTAHLRWNLLYESTGGATVTAAGDDDVHFATGEAGQEPTLRPPAPSDAGTPSDGGTACTREFAVAPAPEPTAPRAPVITRFSREPGADPLCPQPALAYFGLVDLTGSSVSSLTSLGVAFPGFQVGPARFLADPAGPITFVACASNQQARALIRLTGAGSGGPLSFDACAEPTSSAATSCPFPSSLPAPSTTFTPTFTPGPRTVTLCPGGLRLSFSFTSSLVTAVGYAVEQPIARVQTVPNATDGASWSFASCLLAPDLAAFHLQLIGLTGQRGPIECLSIR